MSKKLMSETREVVTACFAPETLGPDGKPAPTHTHTCDASEVSHVWRCPSPYCSTIVRPCPDHGGEIPKLFQ